MLSAQTVEIAPRPSAPLQTPVPARRQGSPSGARVYVALGSIALALAALSLLLPSTPSYDPWAWLIWGREIVHASLHTAGGPSWKPLPVLFTTAFAPFGSAAPDLWLVVARAGALLAVAMAFKVTLRLARQLIGAQSNWVLPIGLLAGSIAAASMINSRGFASDNALGYSEGLAAALVLIAFDRHLHGARRQALVVGFFAALDRPEVWLAWGPYGAYLFWKDTGARKLVLALFALTPALWFLPELWGSGHLLRGVTRAEHPRSNSPAFSKCPFCTEFGSHAWRSVWTRVKLPAIAAAAAAGLGVWRGLLTGRRRAAGLLVLALVATGVGWWVVIALETQAGFSGNDRYLTLSAALVSVAGGVAWGWGAFGVAERARRLAPQASNALVAGIGVSALAIALFLTFPSWLGRSVVNVGSTRQALAYQAELRQDLGHAVTRLAGPARILRCGSVMTEGFQVPMVAWALGVPVDRVAAPPPSAARPGPAPGVIFQTRATRRSFLLPIVSAWTGAHYRLVAHAGTFRVYSSCAGKVAL